MILLEETGWAGSKKEAVQVVERVVEIFADGKRMHQFKSGR